MDQLAKLKWQCRRGTKELDLLLNHYLDTRYQDADDTEKRYFVDLLDLEDSVLMTQYDILAAWLNQTVNS
jgi:antitoxin CptB